MKILINETFIFEEKPFFILFGLGRKIWRKKITEFNVNENIKVKDLKKAILRNYELENNLDLFKIRYKDVDLNDDITLKEAGIKENDKLVILCKDKRKLSEVFRNQGLM